MNSHLSRNTPISIGNQVFPPFITGLCAFAVIQWIGKEFAGRILSPPVDRLHRPEFLIAKSEISFGLATMRGRRQVKLQQVIVERDGELHAAQEESYQEVELSRTSCHQEHSVQVRRDSRRRHVSSLDRTNNSSQRETEKIR